MCGGSTSVKLLNGDRVLYSKFEADKTKINSAHLSSTYLIRWKAFELSDDPSRNRRGTSILVLSSTSGGIMKVIMTVSRSDESRRKSTERHDVIYGMDIF